MCVTSYVLRKELGQALTESIVLLLVLAVLWVLIPYLGKVVDLQLKTQHAASLNAWRVTQDSHANELFPDLEKQLFFKQSSRRWTDRAGQPWLSSLSTANRWISLSSIRLGGDLALEMRRAWELDRELYTASVSLETATSRVTHASQDRLGLQAWFDKRLSWSSELGVLVGAGHAHSRLHTQQKIASSQTAWAQSYQRSLQASQAVTERMRRVDEVWGRAEPQFSWLLPWYDEMPSARERNK